MIDTLISQFWFCSNIKVFEEDSQESRKSIDFHQDEIVVRYKNLHQDHFVLEDYREELAESHRVGGAKENLYLDSQLSQPDASCIHIEFDELFDLQAELELKAREGSVTPKITKFAPHDSFTELSSQLVGQVDLESWRDHYHRFVKRCQFKNIQNHQKKKFCKVSNILDRSLQARFNIRSTNKPTALRQVTINSLFVDSQNCLANQSDLNPEFRVGPADQNLVDDIENETIWMYGFKVSWIDHTFVDINKFKLVVIFRDLEENECFSPIPRILGTLDHEGVNVLLVGCSTERYTWQMYEVRLGVDKKGTADSRSP